VLWNREIPIPEGKSWQYGQLEETETIMHELEGSIMVRQLKIYKPSIDQERGKQQSRGEL